MHVARLQNGATRWPSLALAAAFIAALLGLGAISCRAAPLAVHAMTGSVSAAASFAAPENAGRTGLGSFTLAASSSGSLPTPQRPNATATSSLRALIAPEQINWSGLGQSSGEGDTHNIARGSASIGARLTFTVPIPSSYRLSGQLRAWTQEAAVSTLSLALLGEVVLLQRQIYREAAVDEVLLPLDSTLLLVPDVTYVLSLDAQARAGNASYRPDAAGVAFDIQLVQVPEPTSLWLAVSGAAMGALLAGTAKNRSSPVVTPGVWARLAANMGTLD